MSYFKRALAVILKHEGGYVNHPRDPGGITNLGVTLRTWKNWVGREVGDAEMRRLTPKDVAPLYEKRYFNAVRAHLMPPGLGLAVFDFGVNAGPRRAIRYLQIMVGSARDGKWGPNTEAALKRYLDANGAKKAVRRYAQLRHTYYRRLSHFNTFGRGWTRRVNDVRKVGLRWQNEV